MKERIREELRQLTRLTGVSGHEQEVIKHIRSKLENLADDIIIDPWGNLTAIKYGKNPGPKMMIAAHADEIGFVVKNIIKDGFVLFDKSGTASDKVMEGRKVFINGRIPGVIGIKPGHIQSPEEIRRVKTSKECYIDIAVSSREEAEQLGISIGDPIGYESSFMEMSNKDYVCTKSIDNRINCTILIKLFEEIKDMEFDGTFFGCFTVQEETGMKGAFMVGNRIEPDYAIVTDTIPSGDTPDVDSDRELPIHLGKGPACVMADGVGSAMMFTFAHPAVVRIIKEQALQAGVNLQFTTLLGDSYATDSAGLAHAGKGIPTATLAMPRRYSHSPIEMLNLNDAVGSLEILKGIVKNNGKAVITFL
ncbi:MAG: M20/M25/M40 family metallo-hydrolase [Eubacteriales bacterium]|nr:M20/M25/M40 family metallo-hydrolase [Eubacteriales bacterium]